MVFDLTFEEAIDVLKNKVGWVQGENFDEHEYLSLDKVQNVFIKNVVDDSQIGCVFDFYGDRSVEAWRDINSMSEEMKTQKYRFILVLNRDSVKGCGTYRNGYDKDCYLSHKRLNCGRNKRRY